MMFPTASFDAAVFQQLVSLAKRIAKRFRLTTRMIEAHSLQQSAPADRW